MRTKYQIVCVILFALFLGSIVKAATFNPSYIISDEEILDNTTMDLAAIQRFLSSKGSYLASYACQNFQGVMKTASEIIYDAANNSYDCTNATILDPNSESEKKEKCIKVRMNPKFILVLLQKEQGLVESSNPRQSSVDWATGYGCPDGSSCSSRFRGFGKQINSAVLQFYDYMINPQLYTYKAGGTYTFTNPYGTISNATVIVTPANQATAALYNYTPHVYNGNYNFYKIWQRYFVRDYPDGSLLQAKGDPGVWLIQNGKKRPFSSRGALTSRYDINKIITINKSELDKYEKGDPIKFPQYSVVRSPSGSIFLLADNIKRGFNSKEAFRKIGINPEEIINATNEDLSYYITGTPITATTSYPTGALLQDKKTGGVYWVENDQKSPILDRVFLKTKFKYKAITAVDSVKLSKYQTIAPVLFNDGELLRTENQPSVYVITNGLKRPFASGEAFEFFGYKWNNVIIVSSRIIDSYPFGDPIILPVVPANIPVISPVSSTPITNSSASTSSELK